MAKTHTETETRKKERIAGQENLRAEHSKSFGPHMLALCIDNKLEI